MDTFIDLEGENASSPPYSFYSHAKAKESASPNEWILMEKMGKKTYSFDRFCEEELGVNRKTINTESHLGKPSMHYLDSTKDTAGFKSRRKKAKSQLKTHPKQVTLLRNYFKQRVQSKRLRELSHKQNAFTPGHKYQELKFYSRKIMFLKQDFDLSQANTEGMLLELHKKRAARRDTTTRARNHKDCS